MREKKAFAEVRKAKILHLLKKKNTVEVVELAEMLGVTEATIRRDLIFLENKEKLYRTHGGALYREQQVVWQTTALSERKIQNVNEKKRIAQYVASIIRDGESLMIDGGSTTLLVAHELSIRRNLFIITNTSTVGDVLINGENGNKVILIGGELMFGTYVTTGALAENTVRSFRVNTAIIGLTALHPTQGCFSALPQEGEIKRLMLENAQDVIIVADSSKIGNIALSFVCDIKKISKLITDDKIEPKYLEKIKNQGVEVIIV